MATTMSSINPYFVDFYGLHFGIYFYAAMWRAALTQSLETKIWKKKIAKRPENN